MKYLILIVNCTMEKMHLVVCIYGTRGEVLTKDLQDAS